MLFSGSYEDIYDEEGYDMETYNCGGFALNTKDWYIPYPDAEEIEYMENLVIEKGKLVLLEMFVEHMLNEFPNLRLIKDEEELKDYESLILFRIGDRDFHFVKKIGNTYYHKTGWIPKIWEMDKEDVYRNYWDFGRYDSPIKMFAYDERIERI